MLLILEHVNHEWGKIVKNLIKFDKCLSQIELPKSLQAFALYSEIPSYINSISSRGTISISRIISSLIDNGGVSLPVARVAFDVNKCFTEIDCLHNDFLIVRSSCSLN